MTAGPAAVGKVVAVEHWLCQTVQLCCGAAAAALLITNMQRMSINTASVAALLCWNARNMAYRGIFLLPADRRLHSFPGALLQADLCHSRRRRHDCCEAHAQAAEATSRLLLHLSYMGVRSCFAPSHIELSFVPVESPP